MEKEVSRLSAGFAFQTEGKNLGIGYNQLWGDAQGLQGCFQAVCRAAHNWNIACPKVPAWFGPAEGSNVLWGLEDPEA